MKTVILTSAAILGSLSQMAPAASQTTILKNRIAEKDRVIRSLEKEIEDMHALLRKNNLRPTKRSASSSTRSVASGATYTVRKGDSLSKIAKRSGVSLRSLMAVNKGVDPRRLRIGQKIKLPSSAKVSAVTNSPAVASTPLPSLGKLPEPIKPSTQVFEASTTTTTVATTSYTVQSKDTLYGIAKKHKTSVANILELNQGLNPNKLRIGQKIQLASNAPVAKKAPAQPAVAKKPAKKQTTPATAPTTTPQNTLTQQPKQNTVAKAPAEAPAPATTSQPAPAVTSSEPAVSKVRTVSVTRQMTFEDFATQHNASVEQLNEMNNLRLTKGTVLAQGSELYVPNSQY